MTKMTAKPFWKTKKLSEFTPKEWESVCAHCGQCCLLKLQDEDSGDICYTNVICRYHDCKTHLCTRYADRCTLVPTCLKLTPQNLNDIFWIPETCAYNILNRSGDLPNWHPLVSGKPLPQDRQIDANVVSELDVPEAELEDHIIEDEDDAGLD